MSAHRLVIPRFGARALTIAASRAPSQQTGDAAPALPVVGIPTDLRPLEGQSFHLVGDKYVRPLVEGVGALPLLVPALAGSVEPARILDALDGLLVPGSPSNVEPGLYGGPPSAEGTPHDPARDATTLPLIRAALALGVPVLAICRGVQELNVALGGTLHQDVAGLPGRIAHHGEDEDDLDVLYGEAHPVALSAGGLLARLTGRESVTVNSVHYQGLDRVAERLSVEAVAPDGTIEAVRVIDAPGFALGVQWHPEYAWSGNPTSRAIFQAFGEAVHARAALRRAA